MGASWRRWILAALAGAVAVAVVVILMAGGEDQPTNTSAQPAGDESKADGDQLDESELITSRLAGYATERPAGWRATTDELAPGVFRSTFRALDGSPGQVVIDKTTGANPQPPRGKVLESGPTDVNGAPNLVSQRKVEFHKGACGPTGSCVAYLFVFSDGDGYRVTGSPEAVEETDLIAGELRDLP